jgi:hypothetical protein
MSYAIFRIAAESAPAAGPDAHATTRHPVPRLDAGQFGPIYQKDSQQRMLATYQQIECPHCAPVHVLIFQRLHGLL